MNKGWAAPFYGTNPNPAFDEKTMGDNNKPDLIPCDCGCGQLRPELDERGRSRRFIYRHYNGSFSKSWNKGGVGFKHSEETKVRFRLRVGDKAGGWKGGRYISSKGYHYLYKPNHHFATKDGYVFEHRIVWEEYHNAVLLPWGDIHHRDHDKLNNKIENLDAMIHGKHTTLTNTKHFSNVCCHYCNDSKTYIKKNGKPMWYHDKNDWESFVCKQCYDKLRKVMLLEYVTA